MPDHAAPQPIRVAARGGPPRARPSRRSSRTLLIPAGCTGQVLTRTTTTGRSSQARQVGTGGTSRGHGKGPAASFVAVSGQSWFVITGMGRSRSDRIADPAPPQVRPHAAFNVRGREYQCWSEPYRRRLIDGLRIRRLGVRVPPGALSSQVRGLLGRLRRSCWCQKVIAAVLAIPDPCR
jgi:hypothetical protein